MLQRCIYRVAALTARPLSHNVATARPCLVVASTTKAASCFSLTTQRCMQTSAAVKQAVQATQPLSMCAPSDESHDDFKPKLKVPSTDQAAIDAIDRAVKNNDVLLFMKGTPDNPRCGFSSQTVKVLQAHGVGFGSVNVLANEQIRNGIKTYSDWPTIPQLYVKGEFIGGCDIVVQMHQSGELAELLEDIKAQQLANEEAE